MGNFKYAAAALVGFLASANAASNDEWAMRSIYQVITDRFARSGDSDAACNITKYCGGSWAGLVDKLDYIQGMGFTAVQISPVNKNLEQDTIDGEAFHGYWPQDLYALNEHFGSADDLKSLVSALHKRDMYLLVDVVANEMAYDIGDANMTSSTKIDYSVFTPFNTSADYDPFCTISDWNNATQYTTCWLGTEGVATPRIKTTDSGIKSTLDSWINNLVSTYSIDGIRLDGAKQIEFGFFKDFIQSAGVYTMAEVDDNDANLTCSYQSYTGGLENYPLYYTILEAFTAGNMPSLVSMVQTMRTACSSPQYLSVFIENQDNERFASIDPDMALAKNALAFTILSDGIPKMYYGQEQHLTGAYSPYNRQEIWSTNYNTSTPLYQLTATLNKLRNYAITLDDNYVTNASTLLYTDNSTYVTRKGPDGVQIISVLSNQGTAGGAYKLIVDGVADAGTSLTEVTGCTTVTAGTNGSITVDMDKGQPRVFFPTFQMKGSGLCGYSSGKSSATSTGSGGASSTPSTTGSAATASSTNMARGMQVPSWMGLVALGVAVLM
ncbi:hypothetical protein ASPZODRAFT_148084 [Penicilliopsis zonata CBS 506.65]|uniref:alpha-amylase n=1 Tax=Penicilliopsis zonata CBS 506.65 TaxID=1073090 RepID=A0A1L9STS2_9EURO|nr:hypothetical protein ASPZODRAFT_148084 [Penicilliopsis zonata CBS 506.65]OJJ50598.1 hypothetical protein ASPZODRAFT_148084 [Penicilliopsis zonata CBS 506.65]